MYPVFFISCPYIYNYDPGVGSSSRSFMLFMPFRSRLFLPQRAQDIGGIECQPLLSMSRRNTAWLDDPRCRHMRKPPAWYEDSEPIFISGPSLNMEKIAYEERERLWHQSASASFYEESENSCLTDTFCTCVSYSRTSQRLRLALSGKDATTVPEQPWFSPDCMQYCLCLPCKPHLPLGMSSCSLFQLMPIKSTVASLQSYRQLSAPSTTLTVRMNQIGIKVAAVLAPR